MIIINIHGVIQYIKYKEHGDDLNCWSRRSNIIRCNDEGGKLFKMLYNYLESVIDQGRIENRDRLKKYDDARKNRKEREKLAKGFKDQEDTSTWDSYNYKFNHVKLFENFDEENSRISQERETDQWNKVQQLAERFLEESDCAVDFEGIEQWLKDIGEDESYAEPISDYLMKKTLRMEEEINEHDIVYLKEDLPGIKSGSRGTVVHVHQQGKAFEVEFSNGKVETVKPDQIKK